MIQRRDGVRSVVRVGRRHSSWSARPVVFLASLCISLVAPFGEDDTVEALQKQLLESEETQNANEYRRLVGKLLDDEAVGVPFLCTLLAESDNLLKRQVILQGFATEGRAELGPAAIRLLAVAEEPLRVEAEHYLETLGAVKEGRDALLESIRSAAASRKSADVTGAARAATVLLDLSVVDALIDALQGAGESSEVRVELQAALERVTLASEPTSVAAWQSWWDAHRGTPREQLLDEALAAERVRVQALETRLAVEYAARLQAADAATCVELLKDPLAAVRGAALARLEELARDVTAAEAGVVEGLAIHLERSDDATISRAERLRTAAVYGRVAAGDAEARTRLLTVYDATLLVGERLALAEGLTAVVAGTTDDEISERLTTLYDQVQPVDRARVLQHLQRICGDSMLEFLRPRLGAETTTDPALRKAVAAAIGASAPRLSSDAKRLEALGDLIDSLEDETAPDVRRALSTAVRALVPTLAEPASFDVSRSAVLGALKNEAKRAERINVFNDLSMALAEIPTAADAAREFAGLLNGFEREDEVTLQRAALILQRLEHFGPDAVPVSGWSDVGVAVCRFLPPSGGSAAVESYNGVQRAAMKVFSRVRERTRQAGEEAVRAAFVEAALNRCRETGRWAWAAALLEEEVARDASLVSWHHQLTDALMKVVRDQTIDPAARRTLASKAWAAWREYRPTESVEAKPRPAEMTDAEVLSRLALDIAPIYIEGLEVRTDVLAEEWVSVAEVGVAWLEVAGHRESASGGPVLERTARAWMRAGDVQKAREEFEALLRSDVAPKNGRLAVCQLDLVSIYIELDDLDKARETLAAVSAESLSELEKPRRAALQQTLEGRGATAADGSEGGP